MVCLSGGKDSYALLDILIELRERAPVAVRDRRRQPRPEAAGLSRATCCRTTWRARGVAFRIVEQDTYSIVKRLVPEGKTMCSLCSRLRRGILYRVASELGATKIALGHHRDDMVQTLFMNMFFGGRLKGMPPKLVSDDGRHVVIRPLAYVAEADLERWAEHRRLPDHPVQPVRQPGRTCSACRSADAARLGARASRAGSTASSTRWASVVPSHLMDRNLFPFAALQADRRGRRRRRPGLRRRRVRRLRPRPGRARRSRSRRASAPRRPAAAGRLAHDARL